MMKRIHLLLLLISLNTFSQSALQRGKALMEARDFTRAEQVLAGIGKSDADYLKSIEYLGEIKCLKMDWEAALPYFTKLKNSDPSNADYRYKYGGVLGMIAKDSNCFKAFSLIDDIKASFEKAIELDPKHLEARWALIELYLQLPVIAGGSERKAGVYAAQLLKLSPVDGYLAYGKIAEAKHRYKDAEKYYAAAVDAGQSKVCYQKLADLYEKKLKQPEKARRLMALYYNKNKSQ